MSEPGPREFPHETMADDVCREASRIVGILVCHLLEGHEGQHWDDHDKAYWPARISPDCRDGKHPPYLDDAWDDEADTPADCECGCHKEKT